MQIKNMNSQTQFVKAASWTAATRFLKDSTDGARTTSVGKLFHKVTVTIPQEVITITVLQVTVMTVTVMTTCIDKVNSVLSVTNMLAKMFHITYTQLGSVVKSLVNATN